MLEPRRRHIPQDATVSVRLQEGQLRLQGTSHNLGPGVLGGRGWASAVPAGAPLALLCAALAFSRLSLCSKEPPRPERPEAALKLRAPPTPTPQFAIQEELRRGK